MPNYIEDSRKSTVLNLIVLLWHVLERKVKLQAPNSKEHLLEPWQDIETVVKAKGWFNE